MPHQCVKCSRILPLATKELLEGCSSCGGRFFFYIREEQLQQLKEKIIEIPESEKVKIEQDIRDITGIKETDAPVILDFESVQVTGQGKFEIDLANAFNKKNPLVYKLEEGKYLIDLGRTLKENSKEKLSF